jgi:O-antigen ligase
MTGFIGPYAGSTAPTGWWNLLIQGRFEGSLGNPAYVDPYLIFSMFFAAYLWVSEKLEGTLSTLKAWGYGVLIAIFFIFFILGQTRGAFIGLAVGIFALALYLVFSSKGATRKWGMIGFGVLIILGLGLYAIRNEPFVQKLPEGRLLQLSLTDSTAQTRFWVWDEAWKGFLERPILGWGPENFTPVFDKFFNPKFYVPGANSETWFDRAHSVFFDYLVETGILGLLSYLGMFVVFYWEFIKKVYNNSFHNSPENHHRTLTALKNGLIFVVPIAYLVQGIAIFDVLPMYISLFTLLAFSTYYFSLHKKS